MRLVVQRVTRAAVRARGITVAEIGPGLLVLVGVGVDDEPWEAGWLARKVHELRIFEDDQGKMNRSLGEVRGEVLVVPQFTLYGDAHRGRRPSWARAAAPAVARARVATFALALEARGARTRRGSFREHMEVELVNDGPVTLVLEADPGSGSRSG
jgi:D-tyrosyl-tRNA(Tyr) deacylase